MPGARAATQSLLCGSRPKLPKRVGATIRVTASFAANILNGKRILSCMSDWTLAGFQLRCRRRGQRTRGALRVVDFANHVKGAFGEVLELISQDALAPIQGILQADGFPGHAAELLGGEERLGQKSLQAPRSSHNLPVGKGQLLEPEHRDDVLQFRILCERATNLLRQTIVLFADDAG